MASIRQRSGTWQARVRRKGYPDEVASFKTKSEAQVCARSVESAMDQGAHQSTQSARVILLADVLQRYMKEVTSSNRGAQLEAEDIQFLLRQKIAIYSMTNLSAAVVAGYRDDRLKTVGAGTIIRELSILSCILAMRERMEPVHGKPLCACSEAANPTGTNQITDDGGRGKAA